MAPVRRARERVEGAELEWAERRLAQLAREAGLAAEELRRGGAPPSEVYNYVLLRRLLLDVGRELRRSGRVSTETSYIMPGALWLVRALARGRLDVRGAAQRIAAARYLARRLFRVLVCERGLTLLIPTNLSPEDVRVYMWVDRVGYDWERNPLYVLTLYFSFPFDVSELDGRSEYEPVAFLFVKRGGRYVLLRAYARVHYNIYSYDLSGAERIAILFTRAGHTPKILAGQPARVSEASVFRELLDRAWLAVGELATRLTGVREVVLSRERHRVRAYVVYRLPRSDVNPFARPPHPYFASLTFP